MRRLTRFQFQATVSLSLLLTTASSQAVLITDSVRFETQNQSMWSQGPTSNILIEEFLGTRWGRYREKGDNVLADFLGIPPSAKKYELGGFIGEPNTCVGVDTWYGCAGFRADTTTGARLELTTSGQVGVYVGAELFGGGLDIALPVNASVNLPDQVSAAEFFTVTTSGQTLAQGASITANAPSFRAFIDGVFDTENHFYGEACIVGECADGEFDLDIHLGRFDLIEVDSSKADPWSVGGINIPGVPLAKFTKRAPSLLNPDGIDETLPVDPTPEILKPARLLEVEVKGLQQKIGAGLNLFAAHDVLDAKWSLTGYAEQFLRPPGSPGILKNKIPLVSSPGSIPDIGVTYTIANVEVGPVLGLRQEFDLNPVAAVRLQFDVPVTRMEQVQVGTEQVKVGEDCTLFVFCTDIFEERPVFDILPVRHDNGIVEIVLGDDAQLAFNDGIGQLIDRTYLMSGSTLSNTTSLTGRLEATAEFGCLDVPGIGEGCIFDETMGTNNHALGSYNRTFTIGGFSEKSIAEVYQFNDPTVVPGDDPASVPEPETISLFLLGLFGVFSVSRRKRSFKLTQ